MPGVVANQRNIVLALQERLLVEATSDRNTAARDARDWATATAIAVDKLVSLQGTHTEPPGRITPNFVDHPYEREQRRTRAASGATDGS